MISIDVLESGERKLVFVLKGVNAAVANSLRRSVLEDVPTAAIEDIEFRKNSSVLYDEMLAHRLGLVPLTTDLQGYNMPAECKCKGERCASCTVKLTLKAEGPAVVYASDLKSKDPKVKPAYPGIPIVKLLKGQKLELEATAMLGTGKEHSKWAPGHIYYKQKTALTGNAKDPEKVVQACPPGVFEVKAGKLVPNELLLLKYDLAGAVEEASGGEAKLEPTGEYVFYLESFGQLSCRQIMEKAADVFESQLTQFIKLLK